MKKLSSFVKPTLILIGLVLIFEVIIIPGLNRESTLSNILSALLGIATGYFAFEYCKRDYSKKPEMPVQVRGGEVFFEEADKVVKVKRKPRTKKQ